jgi:hypothetical protein
MQFYRISIALLVSTLIAPGQLGAQKGGRIDLSSYREAVDHGYQDLPILKDEKHQARFALVTSWISAEQNSGYLRYRVNVIGYGVSLRDAPSYINRLHSCSMTLKLYDKGHFILREFPLLYERVVSDDGTIVALEANESSKMNIADYKSFLATKDWSISWTC